ncbi:MAG: hypothetical protein AAF632_04950 [Bacteroidota bacterium]
MKLRIQGNSLRLRLTQSEVQRIGQLKAIQETMGLGGKNAYFTYSLHVHTDNPTVTVQHKPQGIRVSIPSKLAQNWVSTDEVGIEEQIALYNGEKLQVLIEKDFRCLHRDSQEEPHQFPSPAAS